MLPQSPIQAVQYSSENRRLRVAHYLLTLRKLAITCKCHATGPSINEIAQLTFLEADIVTRTLRDCKLIG